jgi:hypothetical protein
MSRSKCLMEKCSTCNTGDGRIALYIAGVEAVTGIVPSTWFSGCGTFTHGG